MAQTRAALRHQEVVPPILAVDVRPLGSFTAGPIPEDLPLADLAGFEIRLCEFEGGIDVPGMGADNVRCAVVVPEGRRVVPGEVETDGVGP